MSEQAIVYELRDPETGSPRYVGVTRDRSADPEGALQKRLAQHVVSLSGTFKKIEWLFSLRSRRLAPSIHLLEVVELGQAGQAERRWIQRRRNQGEDLLNYESKQAERIRRKEMELGKRIEDVMREGIDNGETLVQIAAALEISNSMLNDWLQYLGIKVVRVLRFRDNEHVSAG